MLGASWQLLGHIKANERLRAPCWLWREALMHLATFYGHGVNGGGGECTCARVHAEDAEEAYFVPGTSSSVPWASRRSTQTTKGR